MVTMSLPLDESLAEAVEKTAKAAGLTVAEFMTRAIRNAVVDDEVREAVARGLDDVRHGRVVAGESMDQWLSSWGTDDEQEPPACPE